MDMLNNKQINQKGKYYTQIKLPERRSTENHVDSEKLSNDTDLSESNHLKHGRRKMVFSGLAGIALVLVANLIILGNNVLIKEFGIDYVDMILLRSVVQLTILGFLLKLKGNNLFHRMLAIPKSIKPSDYILSLSLKSAIDF